MKATRLTVARPQVADAAAQLLGALDEAAAAANDRVALLASEARFPGVAAARRELAGAPAALAGLLPALRRQLRQPQLEYKAVINQGEHMIELPVDFRGVPKARAVAPQGARRGTGEPWPDMRNSGKVRWGADICAVPEARRHLLSLVCLPSYVTPYPPVHLARASAACRAKGWFCSAPGLWVVSAALARLRAAGTGGSRAAWPVRPQLSSGAGLAESDRADRAGGRARRAGRRCRGRRR